MSFAFNGRSGDASAQGYQITTSRRRRTARTKGHFQWGAKFENPDCKSRIREAKDWRAGVQIEEEKLRMIQLPSVIP
jgi:hypothetical protein